MNAKWKRGLVWTASVAMVSMAAFATTEREAQAKPKPEPQEFRLVGWEGISYILNIQLDEAATAAAVSYVNDLDLGLTPTNVALVLTHNRFAMRDHTGAMLGNGEDTAVVLMPLVVEPEGGYGLIVVGGFRTNQAVADYIHEQGLIEAPLVSPIKSIHTEALKWDGETHVTSLFQVRDPAGTLRFEANWVKPEPYHFHSQDPLGFLAEYPITLRFAGAPELTYAVELFRTYYEPTVGDPDLSFHLDIAGLPECWDGEGAVCAGDIFNGQNDVTRFRFVKHVEAIDAM
jgi:hypothetical protein